jgi:3-methyladenine DNA glycosylase/8-oxoguanine DNA glycosylase
VEPAQLRAAGLAWRKISTLRDLAERMSDGRLDIAELSRLPGDLALRKAAVRAAYLFSAAFDPAG